MDMLTGGGDPINPPPFKFKTIPPMRTWVVKKYVGVGDSMILEEFDVAAHLMEPASFGVQFIKFEKVEGEISMYVARIIWNVEDIEEVARMPLANKIVTH